MAIIPDLKKIIINRTDDRGGGKLGRLISFVLYLIPKQVVQRNKELKRSIIIIIIYRREVLIIIAIMRM